jgi:N-methylhydantoinase A/oxoprolinase/acetone carboxylase beta subunit
MGGTTTDMAAVQGEKMNVIENGATVGSYRTCIRTIRSHSFGLGGDSLIRFDPWRKLEVGPGRALPLALFCHEFPELRDDVLSRCDPGGRVRYEDALEYWVLRRSPKQLPEDERTRAVLRQLEKGPAHMRSLLREYGVRSPRLIGAQELVSLGVIERAGLTPTDILHVSGEFTVWDGEAARSAVQAAARLWDETAEDFTRRVKMTITRILAAEIMQFQSGKRLTPAGNRRGEGLDRWLFDENMEPGHPVLGCQLRLKVPIVGIGAPAAAFLPAVAEAFDTKLILPPHYAVANAVGAAVGNVAARREGEVFPNLSGATIGGYAARLDGRQQIFASYEAAMTYCAQEAARLAERQAQDAGAIAPQVEVRAEQIWDGMGRVTAWAIGKL